MRKIFCWPLILTLVTAGVGVPEPLHAQGLPAIAVGAFIRDLGSSLEAVIRQAEQSGDRLLIRAGTQANIAINNAAVAFDDVLSKRIDQLDDVSRRRLAALQSLIESIQRRTFEDLNQVARQTQTVVSMLPLSDKTPRLDGLSPTFIVPASLSYPVDLRLRGSFLSARDPRLAPQLAAGGQSFPLQANPTDQELRFSIPVQLLADASKSGFGYTKAMLTVPPESRAFPRQTEAQNEGGVGHFDRQTRLQRRTANRNPVRQRGSARASSRFSNSRRPRPSSTGMMSISNSSTAPARSSA
jgi:hypothetical protein